MKPLIFAVLVSTRYAAWRLVLKSRPSCTLSPAKLLPWSTTSKKVSLQVTLSYFTLNNPWSIVEYGISLERPDLPVINVGTKDKPSYLPPEICFIPPGQPYRDELPPIATSNMIKVACNSPADNSNFIVSDGLEFLGLKTNTASLSNFNITVSLNMAVIPARILPAPQVMYAAGGTLSPANASWNMRNVKFHKGVSISNWAVLLIQQGNPGEFSGANDKSLTTFLTAFGKKCKDSGLTVPPGLPTIMVTPSLLLTNADPGRRNALACIRTAIEDKLQPGHRPSFILVLLSNRDRLIYAGVKQLCNMELGLHTVFMLLEENKAGNADFNRRRQYFANVCLKINAKLGGTNHLLSDDNMMRWLKSKKTMLAGVDVTHPSPLSLKGTPSIVAVVASIDDDFAQYPASLGLQRNRNINKNSEEVSREVSSITA